MKLRMPLYAQIFLMLFLYVSTLAIVVFVCLNAQFGFGWDALIRSPLGDRVNTLADAITGQLKAAPPDHWNDILDSFGELHHVKFYIFDIRGSQLAGKPVDIPQVLVAKMPDFMPPMHGLMHHEFEKGGGGHGEHGDPLGPGVPGGLEGAIGPAGPVGMPPGPFEFSEHGLPPFEKSNRNPSAEVRLFQPGAAGFQRNMRHFELPKELTHAHGQFLVHSTNPDRFWICTHVLFTPANGSHFIPSTLVALSDNIWQDNLLFNTAFILEAALVLLLLSLAFWWPFIHSISQSLSKLTVATERIAEGHFDTRLIVNRRDEIGRLSDAVNTMAERLTNYVTGQKRFLGDISHELFTPIARLQMALELLGEDASENQTALVQDIREEILEMTNLVNELLAFSKAGLQGTEPEITIVNVRKVLSELVSKLNLNDIATLNISDNYEVTADILLLTRAFSNILRNSIRYAGGNSPITIKGIDLGEQIGVVISDSGPGVPEEALKRLAEPFFRPEASRSRSSGGVGLGLAIVKSCVEACNGTLSMRNRAQGGFEVEIRLNKADG